MSTKSVCTRGTSSEDLICVRTASTSTWDLVTSTSVAAQTEGGIAVGSCHSDSDADSSEEASEGTDADERTSLKRPMPPGEDTNDGEDAHTGHPASGDESRETPAPEFVLPAAVEKVEIIQNNGTIQNSYFVNCVQFIWENADKEMIVKQITIDQQRTDIQLKSMGRSLKKEIRRCKDVMKECTRQLLHSSAADTEQRERLNRQMAEHREEIQTIKQKLDEIENQRFDQLAKLDTDLEEARRKEREGKTYVFKLGEKHNRVLERVWVGLEQSRLAQLMKRLYEKFKVKLREIGVSCGMRFVVDIPSENADTLARQQDAIQEAILEEILPENFQTEVEWESMVPVLGEVELHPPVQVSEEKEEASADVASAEPLLTYDPMTSIPKRSFEVHIPTSMTEGNNCSVRSLLITGNNILVLADYDNRKVMCSLLDSSRADAAISICLNVRPWDLALYEQDVIAVASDTDVILLLKVEKDVISIVRQVKTERKYMSVTSFGDGDTLVVGSKKDKLGPAVIDVITGEGKVLWMVAGDHTLPNLHWPRSLHVWNRQVLVTDGYEVIHRVDVTLGTTYPALTHPDLKNPRQVTTDAGGNVFVACSGTDCVLVHTVASGQWRPLLTGREQEEREQGKPLAVGVTEDGIIVVSWRRFALSQTVVIGYDLKA